MSSKSSRLTARQVISQPKAAGFLKASQNGSHLKMFNLETGRSTVVPVHSKKVIPIGTLKSIEKQAGIKLKYK